MSSSQLRRANAPIVRDSLPSRSPLSIDCSASHVTRGLPLFEKGDTADPVVFQIASRRSTDTPLGSISLGRMVGLLSRCMRLRCPQCGKGAILSKWKVSLVERCSECNFRYMRSDDNYFDGAMFCSLMIMEGIFALGLALSVILMWPDVPWDALTYVAMGGMVLLAIIMQPLGKVAWIFLDVMFRPIFPEECE